METGLSLGSNLGDRLANLGQARQLILAIPGVRSLGASPVYETEPVDVKPEDQDKAFLNAILLVESALDVADLARRLHAIEADMGRRRSERNAPRVVDIDVIYSGAATILTESLTIPHPQWASRRFVVQPLADVRPDLILPGSGRPVRQILAALPAAPSALLHIREW